MTKNKYITTIAIMAMSSIASLNAATIAIGDTIVVDFGKTGQETTGNWNNIAGDGGDALSGTLIGSGSIKRYSDGAVVDGLSLSRPTGPSPAFGIGGADATPVGGAASFSVSGTIPDSAQNDLSYISDNGATIVIGGLSSSLNYNLEILSMINAGRNALNIDVNGTAFSVDPDTAPWVTAFNGISANGSNEIVISFSAGSATADLQHINALELTAVPEPSAFALLGLGGLALILRRRRD